MRTAEGFCGCKERGCLPGRSVLVGREHRNQARGQLAPLRSVPRGPTLQKDREKLVSIQWKMMRTVVRTEPCHMSNGYKSYV